MGMSSQRNRSHLAIRAHRCQVLESGLYFGQRQRCSPGTVGHDSGCLLLDVRSGGSDDCKPESGVRQCDISIIARQRRQCGFEEGRQSYSRGRSRAD